MLAFQKAAAPAGAQTLAQSFYTCAKVFAREAEQIFYQQWLCVGRSEQIPQGGDYLLAQVLAESILLVRDKSGRARAFFNLCRHRGTRLCTEVQGHFPQAIACPYHAWSYGLDGSLLAARHMREVEGFDVADYPLHACALVEWEGFLWVNLAGDPQPFAAAFAPLLERFTPWKMTDLRLGHRIDYDVRANWKLLFQNYAECYHCSLIHPQLVKHSPDQSGCNDLWEGPFLGGYMDINPGGSLTVTGQTTRSALPGVQGENRERVYYYSLFPNVLLSLHPDYVMVHQLWPEAVDRTRVVCSWFFDPMAMAKPDFDPLDAVEFWDLTNRQDWHVCELTQQGVSSRAYTPGPYAHQEGLLAAFDREYLRMLGL
ncbi:aromatic ring-hydroxylating oxygenase subunit alpha [Anthocerotibacter panamensis]|uniref:aromatic ring-hydroxylating oxygenase subunit alpha n=1 Tax=Anthocerotibacter panamensis TaxID=2857077 RepID=UPI001C401596|nr:aromatic ring-hydroxylating dioxygenase subunit alpha [Anthocerotibacter panamensis]